MVPTLHHIPITTLFFTVTCEHGNCPHKEKRVQLCSQLMPCKPTGSKKHTLPLFRYSCLPWSFLVTQDETVSNRFAKGLLIQCLIGGGAIKVGLTWSMKDLQWRSGKRTTNSKGRSPMAPLQFLSDDPRLHF